MKAKNLLLTLAVGAMAISCNNSGSMTQTSASLKTTADSASFYIGYMYGSGLQQMGFSEVNREALIAGLNSAIAKKEVGKDPREIQMFLNGFMQEVAMKKATENAEKGKKFLEENAKKSGVDTLANGIQYKIIKKGEGAKPAATDMVKVHYRGTLIDGTEFDSSIKRGEPVGTTALQQMPVGSKWEIFIPSDQAYGPRGNGSIGPNETLIFEVELLDIVTPDAKEADQK